MAKTHTHSREDRGIGVSIAPAGPRLLPVFALGMSLGLFFAISYLLCILFYVLFQDAANNHAILSLFLPGFRLLTWSSFILGLGEVIFFGWYIGLVFGPLYNFFAMRWH